MAPMAGKNPDWDRLEQTLVSCIHSARFASELEPESERLAYRAVLRALDQALAEQLGHPLRLQALTAIIPLAEQLRGLLEQLRIEGDASLSQGMPRVAWIVSEMDRELHSLLLAWPDSAPPIDPVELAQDEAIGRGETVEEAPREAAERLAAPERGEA